jgi:type I restriction enzyme M protein
MAKQPKTNPSTPFPSAPGTLHQVGEWLWIPLRKEWRNATSRPEELVRQRFIRTLVDEYGYQLEQMDQERRTQHGHHSPRADIVIWESEADKLANRTPVVVGECKSDGVEIQERDYYQGESYTRAVGCEFFVAHNTRQTAVFRLVAGAPGEFVALNELPSAEDWGDEKRLRSIREALRAFDRKEFQDLLHTCHGILRDVHKMDPGRAFDTISKILFVKMYVERSGLHGTFTTDYLNQRAQSRMPNDPAVHDGLFGLTKDYYKADDLFSNADTLDISEETFRRIVKQLERFNLSETSDDIKGLAFERFLGTTFRGELGQYFTPRPVVEFMVELLDPREGELICDPAAGSGGFLIRAFEHVREHILEDVQEQKDAERVRIEAAGLDADEEKRQIDAAFAKLNQELLASGSDNRPIATRIGRLAWKCIFGTDAEARAARTAKMNMIMHGDGHGGIHYHDGLLDINGIYAGRFNVVITNPPFGANVGDDQRVGASAVTRVPNDPNYVSRCRAEYGDEWESSHHRMLRAEAAEMPILDLFEIGAGKRNRPTEIVFLERCLNLLAPGGRMGIVLPDGNLNNPSLAWLRRWAEGRATLLGVISLPEETFRSSKATVKASVVFLRRFTVEHEEAWEDVWRNAHTEVDPTFDGLRDEAHDRYSSAILHGSHPAEIEPILDEINRFGVDLVLPAWDRRVAQPYPRGSLATTQREPGWQGRPKRGHAARVKELRQEYEQHPSREHTHEHLAALRVRLREIDAAHYFALWTRVREMFDYPVFVAAPRAVGISSTGETGEGVANDLPAVLSAYRGFASWVESGAPGEAPPDFPTPSNV